MKQSFDVWLSRQVERLENEIRTHPVLDSDETPTREELMELRRLAVIHRFLAAQLEKLPKHPRVVRPRNRKTTQEMDIRQFVNVS